MYYEFLKVVLHIIKNYEVHNIFHIFQKKKFLNVTTFETIACSKIMQKSSIPL